jgi:NodT family efflux transporter outer membrane factor (OMF) lipoprotein
MKKYCLAIALLPLIMASGCVNLSPRHAPPAMSEEFPVAYKEDKGWQTAQPRASLDRGSWWEVFRDESLSALIRQANTANQNIAVAAANLRQSRAQVAVARSAFFPGVTAPASVTRSGTENAGPGTRYSVGFSSQWEISFWNALPAFEAAKAQAEATASDYATMRLSVQAELAQNYFQLRAYDGQQTLYEDTIKAYRRAVELTRSQYNGGIATPADVAQAEAQLAQAEAEYAGVQRQRSILEHAIAVLVGQLPTTFTLPRAEPESLIPAVPTGIPADLLERRPDISSAERLVAVANEQIGLARAAWFPTLTLGSDLLYQGTSWIGSSLYTWSVGPSAALTLFEGGKRLAQSESAWAAWEAQVATYRQTVLQAVKDVEDNIGALRHLAVEAAAQDRAVKASREALRLSLSQYRGGMTTYLQVVTNQTAVLSNERNAINVQAQRRIAAVNLIKALGGGWNTQVMRQDASGERTPDSQSR